ncbi:MAG: hypothetical protein M1814_001248 [Vezdaea aestivalis]|nr:MAG: hypothetical protein M1814_001248 [Vezdaea aestivalis]
MTHRWFSTERAKGDSHYAALRINPRVYDSTAFPRRAYPKLETFLDFIDYHDDQHLGVLGSPGDLIYGDVQGTVEHKDQMAEQDTSPSIAGTDVEGRYMKQLKGLLVFATNVFNDEGTFKGAKTFETESARLVPNIFVRWAHLPYLLTLPTKEEKADALAVLGHQALRPNDRKLMVLICHINNLQNVQSPTGYVAAYDLVEDRIIVQKYAETEELGALDGPWIQEMPDTDDGITFYGTVEEFSDRVVNKVGLKEDASDYGFALVVRLLVGEFAASLEHASEWKGVEDNSDVESLGAIEDRPLMQATDEIDLELESIKFPNIESPEHKVPEPFWVFTRAHFLGCFERTSKFEACHLRKAGKKEEAQKIADWYDEALDKLQTFAVEAGGKKSINMGLPIPSATEKPSASETGPDKPSVGQKVAAEVEVQNTTKQSSQSEQTQKSPVELAAEKAYEERIEDEYAKREGGA